MAIERAETGSRASSAAAESVGPTPRLFTVDEYYKMAEAGILAPNERVELLGGVIYRMNPIGPRHHSFVMRLTALFVARLLERAMVGVQGPISLASLAEPEPDFAIVRLKPEQRHPYAQGHATARDVYFLVEIADSSLTYDLGVKADAYAADGIPEVWVLDLAGDRVVVLREPTANGYASVRSLTRGESISPLAFSDVPFTIDEILG
jgi:Uma2 family endonuclease